MSEMNQEEWLKYGWEQGFCGPPLCFTHDGIPTTVDEDDELDEGHDPCLHCVRLYDDRVQRLGIEINHSETNWRAENRGWTR
jgi:hypothetical protein